MRSEGSSNVNIIQRFFIGHPGVKFTIDQISHGTGLTRAQTGSSMQALVRKDVGVIRTSQKGCYVYRAPGGEGVRSVPKTEPVAVPKADNILVLRVVANTTSGDIAVAEGSGKAYRINEL